MVSRIVPAPFSTDPEALEELEACDFTIKITTQQAHAGKASRPIRVYSDGIFDLLHAGHTSQLMQAKNSFPNVYLLVGVSNDSLCTKFKGTPFQTEAERYDAVRNCRFVDEVIKDAPWIITKEFLAKHKIDFVAHDYQPYPCGEIPDIYEWLKKKNLFVATQQTDGVSTAGLVTRIIQKYEDYVKKNRARGYTPKELTVLFSMKRK